MQIHFGPGTKWFPKSRAHVTIVHAVKYIYIYKVHEVGLLFIRKFDSKEKKLA
jgi:hypothetical protein